jgi:hypothetical protein
MSNNPFIVMQQSLINNPDLQVPVTFTPAATGTPQAITGVLKRTPEMEAMQQAFGSTNMFLFVRWADITPNPQRGDSIVVNDFTYEIGELEVDRVGGATLKLKRNGD